jgi:hypothetical protein
MSVKPFSLKLLFCSRLMFEEDNIGSWQAMEWLKPIRADAQIH